MTSAELDRRAFLARLGLLSAVAGGSLALPVGANAASLSASQDDLIVLLRQVLTELTRDTFTGLAAFVVPGQDAYSTAQGTPRAEPGGVNAGGADYLTGMFDRFVALPDDIARGISGALAGALAEVPVTLPPDLPELPPGTADTIAEAVQVVLSGPQALPFSQIIGLLMNVAATAVDPASAHGQFLSPFARLSFGEKAVAFQLLEDPDSPLMAAIRGQLPESVQGLVGGLVPYLVGGLLAFPAFGIYSEWSAFDAEARLLKSRPVGWDISRYDPGVLDGWDDFIGYYQGRRRAVNA